jgi:hypothetical protein
MGIPTRRPRAPRRIMSAMRSPTTIEIEASAYRKPLRASDALRVTLEGPSGERWTAVGGGSSIGDALAFAVASAPADTAWRIVGWADVFGV